MIKRTLLNIMEPLVKRLYTAVAIGAMRDVMAFQQKQLLEMIDKLADKDNVIVAIMANPELARNVYEIMLLGTEDAPEEKKPNLQVIKNDD